VPAPRKIDLIPEPIRRRLAEELAARGFAGIVDVTDALNDWLAEEGLELTVGKTAVGEYSKLLKDQREAFALAEHLLADLDVEAEGDLHRVLMQMIATSAVHMMQAVREEDGHLDPKDLMNLGRMLKDLMGSAGMREKLLAEERARIAREARDAARAEVEQALESTASEAGLTPETLAALRRGVLGLAA